MISERISRNMQEIVLSVMPRACRGRDGTRGYICTCVLIFDLDFVRYQHNCLALCICHNHMVSISFQRSSTPKTDVLHSIYTVLYCLHGLIRVMAISCVNLHVGHMELHAL